MTRANTIPSRTRPLAIVAVLLAALVLIGVLGWQAWRLQQSNSATADAVLREYSALVADEYGRRATSELGYRGYYQLVSGLTDRGDPRAMRAALNADETLAGAARLVAGFFVLAGGEVTTEVFEPSAELHTLLRRIAREPGRRDVPYQSARTASGREQVIYTAGAAPDRQSRVAGFVVSRTGIGDYLGRVFDGGPLLPSSLAQGQVSNQMLFVRVTDPAGTVVFEKKPSFDSRLTVSKILGSDYQGILGGFRVEVSLDPASARSLVIGGLPESRLPMLLVVMAFVVILMITAIWLFRREQAVVQVRADFVSQVSHELRTPLTQIRMFAETLLLDRARTDDDRRRSLEIINREAQRLSHLVDNILRFSDIAEVTRIDRRTQSLAPIVNEICDKVRAIAGSVTIAASTDELARATVDADALRQVILNLLDNAMKFGPAGQTITVSLTRDQETVRLTVDDQGPGIPESERNRVWKPFYRLRREHDTAIGGTGIGLSIVQELVEAMDGHCRITAAGTGARVCVEFPEDARHE